MCKSIDGMFFPPATNSYAPSIHSSLSCFSHHIAIMEAGPCQGGLQGLNPCSSWTESPEGCEASTPRAGTHCFAQGLPSSWRSSTEKLQHLECILQLDMWRNGSKPLHAWLQCSPKTSVFRIHHKHCSEEKLNSL